MRNTKYYSFTRLIRKYTKNFSVVPPTDFPVEQSSKDEYDDLGNLKNPEPIVPLDAKGAIIPPSNRELYQSGGRLTSSDRILYISEHDHPEGLAIFKPKTKIIYKGITYFVEGDADFLDFGDFYRYTLKGVSAFE